MAIRRPPTARRRPLRTNYAKGEAQCGADLARANSPPAVAEECQWIVFTTPGQQETFLTDSNQATQLINRVERLLGIKFKASGYLG